MTVTVESLNNPASEPHIRSLWISQEFSSQAYQISCEVDTGASCNILPLYKAKALFRDDIRLAKPTVNHDSPVVNFGSCIVYLYQGGKKYRVLVERDPVSAICYSNLDGCHFRREGWCRGCVCFTRFKKEWPGGLGRTRAFAHNNKIL